MKSTAFKDLDREQTEEREAVALSLHLRNLLSQKIWEFTNQLYPGAFSDSTEFQDIMQDVIRRTSLELLIGIQDQLETRLAS